MVGAFAVVLGFRHGDDQVRSPECEMGPYAEAPLKVEVRVVTLRKNLRGHCGYCFGDTSAVYTG